MQNGSVIRAERQRGPDVWEFRWREPAADGKRKHRRLVLGSVEQLADEAAARQATSALRLELKHGGAWLKTRSTTVFDLVSHYRERELDPDTVWKTYSTKVTYEGYLNKWILPRWEAYQLVRVNAGEVELWLQSLPLARSSCAKIRNVMSVIFNHGIRHEICDRNPIQLLRQSAKRRAAGDTQCKRSSEAHCCSRRPGAHACARGLRNRLANERALRSQVARYRLPENEISVTQSIVFQVVGPCKTEASQKLLPLDSRLAAALKMWRDHTKYSQAGDWIFASPAARGQRPYWGQCLMRKIIRPAAAKVGITQHIGWHTFRHTYSSLLRANKTDIKVTQELLRHASSRVTLDTYTQAVTAQKRRAQSRVIRLLQPSTTAAG
jgi:integrase